MKIAVATLLFAVLTTATLSNGFPTSWGDYYRNALHRNHAKLQQAGQQCLVGEVPASFSCKSARHTEGGKNYFVHVCPSQDGPGEVCYNSKLYRCCEADVERGLLECVSQTKLSIGGQDVTVGIYKTSNQGKCVYILPKTAATTCCEADNIKKLPCQPGPTIIPPPPQCEQERDIYFALDATDSVGSEIFCRFAYVIQLIVAAINPSGARENSARVSTVLFEYDDKNVDPTHLFTLNDRCGDAVRTNIPRVVHDYRLVENNPQIPLENLVYPQVGSTKTTPYSALVLISEDIRKFSNPTRPATVITLTDGKPQQTLTSIVKELIEQRQARLIAAGIGSPVDINDADLQQFASSLDDVIYERDLREVINFTKRIIERMNETRALCVDQANQIVASLNKATVDNLNRYCSECMFVETPSDSCKNNEFPQCGAQNLEMQGFDDNLESPMIKDKEADWKKLVLEEAILAEVEKVLEMDEQRMQEQVVEEESFVVPAVYR